MNAAATITEISNSSPLLWDLLCKVEDNEVTRKAAAAQLTGADRVIFFEEVADMDRKFAAANPIPAPKRGRFYPAACKVSRHEGMILAAQEADSF